MAVWFDNGSRYIQARWSGTVNLPIAVAFWYCTDQHNQVIWRSAGTANNTDYIEIGIDSSGNPYIECSKYKLVPSPGLTVGRATSTFTLSRMTWFHVVAVANTYTNRYIYVNGANSGNNNTSVVVAGQVVNHIGCGTDYANGGATPAEMYPNMDLSGGSFINSDYARGYIADFAIWSGAAAAFNSNQIGEMYRSPMPHLYHHRAVLAHYLPFFNAPHLADLVGQSTWATAPYLINRRWGLLRIAGQPADGDQFTIDTQQYTYKTTLTGAAYEIKIGLNVQTTRSNTGKAIMATGVAGTDYGTGTAAHTTCWGGGVGLGNNNDDPIFVYEMDTGSVTAPAFTIDTNVGGNLYAEDIDQVAITVLGDDETYFYTKRGASWWDNTGAPEDGVGDTTHGHNPPIDLGHPVTVW